MKITMHKFMAKLQTARRELWIFIAAALICSGMIVVFLFFYFNAYKTPYMQKEIIDLSESWQYHTEEGEMKTLENLRSGPEIKVNEVLTLYKKLDENILQAALMLRVNHQTVSVYLDEIPLLTAERTSGNNPGMSLEFILLPENYAGKTLKIEMTSPYDIYAGRTGPIFLGDIPSLEAYALSNSMRSVIIMSMCLLIGASTIVMTFMEAANGFIRSQNLAIGIFAIIWALYYVCTEYIVFQFFSPLQMSYISLGLYFSIHLPLTLFFYFSFRRYQRCLLPMIALQAVFMFAAALLQAFNVAELPRLVNINNILLVGLIYVIVLAVLEAVNKNRLMQLSLPFLVVAYVSMLYNFKVFYTRSGVVPYSYRDTYFLFVLFVLIYSMQQFFSNHYRRQKEAEILQLTNNLAKENYEQIKEHLQQVGSLKHEIKSHLIAMHMYLNNERYEEARHYLDAYTYEVSKVIEAEHHNHFLVNAIIDILLQKAQKAETEVFLTLPPCRIGIPDPDLYSLLNNILENALEACAAVPNSRERQIHLTIARKEPYLYITCENSKNNQANRIDNAREARVQLKTSKADSQGHGYGLFTISGIVDKYQGLMDVNYDDISFTITIAVKDE